MHFSKGIFIDVTKSETIDFYTSLLHNLSSYYFSQIFTLMLLYNWVRAKIKYNT